MARSTPLAGKASVQYTDHGTHKEHCSKCEHYVDNCTCSVVKGDIVPGGWCSKYKRKLSNG
jgi:hypothetical protein